VIPALALELIARGLNQYGRIEEALDTIKAAVAIRRGREAVAWMDVRLEVQTAAGLTETGHYREATELLNKAAETLHRSGDPRAPLPNDFLALEAELLLAQGHADEAAQSFAAFRTVVPESGAVSRTVLEQKVTEAEIDLARGDAEKAIAAHCENSKHALEIAPSRSRRGSAEASWRSSGTTSPLVSARRFPLAN
jgi:tetratricopeptide (TPR) repeat protein